MAVQYEPPPGMRPGQIGTLVDEKADPRDVTATLVDLAVRGYLRIDDLGEKKSGAVLQGARLPAGPVARKRCRPVPLRGDAAGRLFKGRTEVAMSDLKTTFASSMATVQKQLYKNVTGLGWFRSNPQTDSRLVGHGRNWPARGGRDGHHLAGSGHAARAVATAADSVGSHHLATTRNAPARTAKGTAALQQARGFELYISKAEANQLRFEEGEDLFSKYLPYAIAFGVADKWAKKFEELARQGRTLGRADVVRRLRLWNVLAVLRGAGGAHGKLRVPCGHGHVGADARVLRRLRLWRWWILRGRRRRRRRRRLVR